MATFELLKALEEKWANEHEVGHEPLYVSPQKPVVVLGGPEVSWLPVDAEIFLYADYVIRGEGEDSFRSLCYEIFNDGRPAMGAKSGSRETVFINQGDTTVDVNKIKTAYSLYTDEDLRRKLVYVEASRGCPFACEFCQASLWKQASVWKQGNVRRNGEKERVREFPLEPFLAEMGTLIARGGRTIKFLDRTFNLNIPNTPNIPGMLSMPYMDRAAKIMEFFLERIEADAAATDLPDDTKGRPLCVHFEMVPSRFPQALKELLRRFPRGSLRLEIGIQTFNKETAALIHRAGNIAEELEVLEFLRRETNAILHVDLIAGLPGEDIASFGAGFDRLWQLMSKNSSGAGFEIQLGILKCLPGTPIAGHNETHKMLYSVEPPYEVIETGAIPAAELDRIKNFARFWEVIVNRNPFPDLIQGLVPPGEKVFWSFMDLSKKLHSHFGRNWGIDREEMRLYLESHEGVSVNPAAGSIQ